MRRRATTSANHKHEANSRGSGNARNSTRLKTVLTDDVGPVQFEVPRSLNGSQQRWTMPWKPALNAFAITVAEAMPVAEHHRNMNRR